MPLARGLLMLCVLACSVRAQDPAPERAPSERESVWQPYFRQHARDYRIAPSGEPERTFTLKSGPLLRWTQPVRGGDDGAVYLWLDRGRPAAIGTIFAWPHSSGNYVVQHEFHSLALEPISARFRDRAVWQPDRPGLELKAVPDGPAPAEMPAQRLRQIRALVRDFSAESTGAEGGKWELRLLNQPLYRYQLDPSASKPEAVLDGALFAFVQGTDPEIILLVEARQDGDSAQWQYACARFSDHALRISHKGAVVWEVPRSNPRPDAPHYYFAAEQRQPPTAAEAADEQPQAGDRKRSATQPAPGRSMQ